jgi:Fe2+ transport system protein FeoA
MGLRIGDKIEVVTNLDRGQLVVATDYNRYALGRGLAKKILVELVRS